jgi:DNA-binding MarR family transcriptional regulator
VSDAGGTAPDEEAADLRDGPTISDGSAAASGEVPDDLGDAGSGKADISSALSMDTASRVIGRLFGLAPRLVELQGRGAHEFGMSYARGRVVAALHASGPVVMRALSQAVGVSPRTITGLIDSLEADGWVERRAHPTDRRATIVALTPAAEKAFARLLQGYIGLSEDLLSGVPEADQQCALAVLDHISVRLATAVSRGFSAFGADPPVLPRDQGSG